MSKENSKHSQEEATIPVDPLNDLATNIALEAVHAANIPKWESQSPPVNQRWSVAYSRNEEDVVLTIQFNRSVTNSILHTSIGMVSFSILKELETIFTDPRALEVLAVEQEQVNTVIFDKSVRLTIDYIHHLPIVIFHSFHQSLNETLVSHIKKFVDFDMRKYFEEIGKPRKKFTLLPNNKLSDLSKLFPQTNLDIIKDLENIDEEFCAYRQGNTNDRKIWLTQDAFAKLPVEFDQLHESYKKAKKDYKEQHEAFFKLNRRANLIDWVNHWQTFCAEEYPNLFLINDFRNYSAAQLAYKQLGERYDFTISYMERLVRNSRRKSQNKNHKTDK